MKNGKINVMKTKMNLLNVLFAIFFGSALNAQTIAVPNLSTNGLNTTPEVAAKLTRLELVKISKYPCITVTFQSFQEINCFFRNVGIIDQHKLRKP